MELRRMAQFLEDDGKAFAELLAKKTSADILREHKAINEQIGSSDARLEKVTRLYEKVYEDNAGGRLSDEREQHIHIKYDGIGFIPLDELIKREMA